MNSIKDFIKPFETISINDIPSVGGKNASLGEMISTLSKQGVRVPTGFAITADAFWHVIDSNNIKEKMQATMAQLTDYQDSANLAKVGAAMRSMINEVPLPKDLADQIIDAYKKLCEYYKTQSLDVAVRSSATAEDLPNASFAGLHESYLNVSGQDELLDAVKKCMASLYTDRAIVYRIDKGFDHFKVALSVGVQKMVHSDRASSGVMFTLDTETGFKDIVMIESSYGLGEAIVQGQVIPDEFFVHKPTLELGYAPIIQKRRGEKKNKIIYSNNKNELIKKVDVDYKDQIKFSLSDDQIIELARSAVVIEKHYTAAKASWCPMDIEWALDADDHKLYIIQARPETIHGNVRADNAHTIKQYVLQEKPEPILTGLSIGHQIVSGTVRVIEHVQDIASIKKGEILVAQMTDPDWVPAMKKAAGIITEKGGRTCHAAIVSRELGVPAVVGTLHATQQLKTGQVVTIDCSSGSTGFVYDGQVPYQEISVDSSQLSTDAVAADIMVNIADPDSAFRVSFLPNDGVGLARLEFIISNAIKIHPMALVYPERVKDKNITQQINELTVGYEDKKQFFVDKLSQGIGMIAAAFYPKPVIVRLSDFKTNEYRNLIGGTFFEPIEENPMLGFRGASRYYHEQYKHAFALECDALKKVREVMGLKNVKVMIPFVRTVNELEKVVEVMSDNGLKRGNNDLEIIMMAEIPSNILLVEKFSEHVDGFSIGSNDLTQLTLAVDRDSTLLAPLFDERDEAVLSMFDMMLKGAKRAGRYVGICGQAPSDYPEIADYLLKHGISSVSLNPDSVVPFLKKYVR